MRKIVYGVLDTAILLGVLLGLGGTKEAFAQVRVDISIGPPPIVIAEPPAMVFMPDFRVYFVPDPVIDVFFYNNYWWSPRGDRWYRARAYNGPWGIVQKRYIPSAVHRIPKNYRSHYEKETHIPYGQWKKQGKHQNKEKRRDRPEDRRENKRDDRQDHKKEHGHGR